MKAEKSGKKRKKILFVCTGNTCRSPMAEYLLRRKIKAQKIRWWDVSSCGICAEVGGSISKNSQIALSEVGITAEKFAPRQLTQKLIESSNIVICMTSAQKQMLEDCGNVLSFKDICGFDVPDPYGFGVEQYRITRDAIDRACDKIIENYILKFTDGEDKR